MPWIESHSTIGRHRKTIHAALSLGIEPVQMVGHLHLLWHAALEQQEDGDLRDWPDSMVAFQAQYRGDAGAFVVALTEAGWLTEDRLLRGWLDYVGRYLEAKYRTADPDRLAEIYGRHGAVWRDQRGGKVYFIECDGAVKIGFSKNPWARLETLKSSTKGEPVLLGWIPGTARTEAEIRERFASLHINREWYTATDEIRELARSRMGRTTVVDQVALPLSDHGDYPQLQEDITSPNITPSPSHPRDGELPSGGSGGDLKGPPDKDWHRAVDAWTPDTRSDPHLLTEFRQWAKTTMKNRSVGALPKAWLTWRRNHT